MKLVISEASVEVHNYYLHAIADGVHPCLHHMSLSH